MPFTKAVTDQVRERMVAALADPENPPSVYCQDQAVDLREGENGVDVTDHFIARWREWRWVFTCARPAVVTHVAAPDAYVLIGGARPGLPEHFGVGSTIEVYVEKL